MALLQNILHIVPGRDVLLATRVHHDCGARGFISGAADKLKGNAELGVIVELLVAVDWARLRELPVDFGVGAACRDAVWRMVPARGNPN